MHSVKRQQRRSLELFVVKFVVQKIVALIAESFFPSNGCQFSDVMMPPSG